MHMHMYIYIYIYTCFFLFEPLTLTLSSVLYSFCLGATVQHLSCWCLGLFPGRPAPTSQPCSCTVIYVSIYRDSMHANGAGLAGGQAQGTARCAQLRKEYELRYPQWKVTGCSRGGGGGEEA